MQCGDGFGAQAVCDTMGQRECSGRAAARAPKKYDSTLRCASSSALLSMLDSIGMSWICSMFIMPWMRSPPNTRNRLREPADQLCVSL